MSNINKTLLPDGTLCYTFKFKNKKEENIIYEYLKSIDAHIICTTHLDKYGYFEYYLED